MHASLPHRLLLAGVGEPTDAQRFYREAFARLAHRLALPFGALFAAAPDSSYSAEGGKDCGWSLCTAGGAAGGGPAAGGGTLAEPASPAEVATCYCESVFSLTQVVLSVVLPLLLVGCAEASQRRQFAACQLSAAAQREEAEGPRAGRRRRRRRSGSAAWCITYDGMRLLALLMLIQVRAGLLGGRGQRGCGGSLRCCAVRWGQPLRPASGGSELMIAIDLCLFHRRSACSSACALASGRTSTLGRALPRKPRRPL